MKKRLIIGVLLLVSLYTAIPEGLVIAETSTRPNITYFSEEIYYIDYNGYMTINGTHFGNIKGKIINIDKNIEMAINVSEAEIGGATWIDNHIYGAIPVNNGGLSAGPNRLVIETAEGARSDPFTVYGRKLNKISSITPSIINFGDEIEISGEDFGDRLVNNGAVVEQHTQKQLNVLSWSDTKIRAVIGSAEYFDDKQNHLSNGFRINIEWTTPNNGTTSHGDRLTTPSYTVRILPATCSSWVYSDWGACSANSQQSRTVISSAPVGCTGGSPILTQSCVYIAPQPQCSSDTWSCDDWDACSSAGTQARSCTKTFDCQSVVTLSPATSQSCTYVPLAPICTADTWECEEWNSCSPSGIQSRSCSKTFDCPNVQTAAPATDQFCAASKPAQSSPSQSDEISNQDTIVKATVKLICPINERSWNQGSGTVIDSIGTILTNKHVIAGTPGCLVGFIDDFDDEPYFGERQIADIIKTSPTQDIAVLRIRNPKNKKLSYINTTKNVSSFPLGTKISTYGYPALFGSTITYTSGDFSGTDGNYLKTTAILEHGNSGGGAYLTNGTFLGMPTAKLDRMGYILSVNNVNAWLGNSSIALSDANNNQYSRVSVLEDIDLNTLDSLNLFIPKTDEAGNITVPAQIGFFPDVPETHPNAIAIEVLRERNIISGYPDGTFKPENTVNRAELLKILIEGKIGKPDKNEYENCFPDVTTQWFAPYVCYAKAEGWVQGYPDGKFKPEQTVNKVEALKMLINSQDISTTETITSKPFNDIGTTDWFAKYVAKAKSMNILEETGSTFSPGEGMKRAGISENLYRILIQ